LRPVRVASPVAAAPGLSPLGRRTRSAPRGRPPPPPTTEARCPCKDSKSADSTAEGERNPRSGPHETSRGAEGAIDLVTIGGAGTAPQAHARKNLGETPQRGGRGPSVASRI